MGVALDDYEPRIRFSRTYQPRITFTRPSRSMRQIADDVCRTHRITMAELCSPRRHNTIARIRFEFWWLCRQETKQSFPQIGYFTGGRDHTTVLHGVRRYAKLMANPTTDSVVPRNNPQRGWDNPKLPVDASRLGETIA